MFSHGLHWWKAVEGRPTHYPDSAEEQRQVAKAYNFYLSFAFVSTNMPNVEESEPEVNAQVNRSSVELSPDADPLGTSSFARSEDEEEFSPDFKAQVNRRTVLLSPTIPTSILPSPRHRDEELGPDFKAQVRGESDVNIQGDERNVPVQDDRRRQEQTRPGATSPVRTSSEDPHSLSIDVDTIRAHLVDDDVLDVAEVVDVKSLRRKRLIVFFVSVIVVAAVIAAVATTAGSNDSGQIQDPTPAPTTFSRNDFCEDARLIQANEQAFTDNLANATSENIDTVCMNTDVLHARGRWYTFEFGGPSAATLNVCVTQGNVSAPVAFMNGCGNLECLDKEDVNLEEKPESERCAVEYSLSFVTKSIRYWFLIYSMDDEQGDYESGPDEFDLTLISNDICEGAFPVNPLKSFQRTVATVARSSFETHPTCHAETPASSQGVWFKITGSGAEIRATLCAPEVESALTLYTGDCSELACVDAVQAMASDCGPSSSISWISLKGTEYFLRLSSEPAADEVSLEIISKRDSCEAALGMQLDTLEIGSTIGAANQTIAMGCNGGLTGNVGPGVWFSVEGTGTVLEATTCVGYPSTLEIEADFDSIVHVFAGSSCGDLECIAANDDDMDTCRALSAVRWLSESGRKYYILVSEYNTRVGNFALITRRYNDHCEDAVGPLELGSVTYGSTANATLDGIEACGGAPASSHGGVWYKVIGTGGLLFATTCTGLRNFNGDFNSEITLLSGSCGNLVCIDGNMDGTVNCGTEAEIIWQSLKGVEYYILVHGEIDPPFDIGGFALEFRESLNEVCELSIGLHEDNLRVNGTTIDSEDTYVEACGSAAESTAPGVWYRVATSGLLLAEVCSAGIADSYFTQLTVLEGSCDNQTCVDGSVAMDFIEGTGFVGRECTSVQWFALGDKEYYIYVHGFRQQTGKFELELKKLDL